MALPQMPQHRMPIKELFEISTGKKQFFGIPSYQAVAKYEDPNEQIKQREYLKQKKGEKDRRYLTKKGSFLDIIFKNEKNKCVNPVKYNVGIEWPNPHPKDPKKINPTKRNTFLDQIQAYNKKNNFPGPDKYKVLPNEEDIKKKKEEWANKKLYITVKPSPFQHDIYKSTTTPGPGTHNPHDGVLKMRPPPQWDNPKGQMAITARSNSKKKPLWPDIGTYNPLPVTYRTFSEGLTKSKEKGAASLNKKGFGAQDRFQYQKKTLNYIKLIPGPGNYDMVQSWTTRGKEQKGQKDWMNRITKGVSMSIYLDK